MAWKEMIKTTGGMAEIAAEPASEHTAEHSEMEQGECLEILRDIQSSLHKICEMLCKEHKAEDEIPEVITFNERK